VGTRVCTRIAAVVVALFAIPVAGASAQGEDYAQTALNILPSGQYGSIPPPPGADAQAQMYDDLTPLFDQVAAADLTNYFKSEGFGVGPDGPATEETVPYPGVKIVRDRFNVPHVTAETYDGGIWAAGWIAAEDRGLFLQQTRFNGRVAAVDVPNLNSIDLISSLQNFQPSAATEAELAKQTDVLLAAGPEGQAVLHDIDTFISGINDYLAINSPTTAPWTRNDVYALNSVKSEFLGQGGGGEARRSQFLGGLIQRLGPKKGMSVFNDLRQFKNPGSPVSVDGKFKYGHIPKHAKGSVVLDPGSLEVTDAAPGAARLDSTVDEAPTASNVLMIDREHSATGRPLMVGGPQIRYFYPGLVYEIDMHAPGLNWRGATSAPFPGYLLIGRGEDFANTLTSPGTDVIDQYVETLCNGSDEMYLYNGECRQMEHFDAGTLGGEPVTFLRTIHGPVVGYATVNGERVAISSKRSSYGMDVLDQLLFRRLSTGAVDSPKSFFKAAALTPQTFNSFYIDNKDIAEYTSGLLPIRPKSVDPGLPTVGTGQFEWTGFLSAKKHPQGVNPRNGTIVNWNNGAARGFGASDSDWGRNGIAQRVDLLNRNLKLLKKDGKWSMASVVAAMNAAGTQDVRAIDTVPLLRKLLKGSTAPSPMAAQMLDLLAQWRLHGGSRLDRDLDGLIDDPGAAIMDSAGVGISNATMSPVLGPQLDELNSLFNRWDAPSKPTSDGMFDGWYQYFERDIRGLLGLPIESPFQNSYCGNGNLKACQQSIWAAIQAAGEQLAAEQGPDPAAWRVSAIPERITFTPGLLPFTMRYTNRPSGIQQVVSFSGHG
jgi:acyl-homoserine lactone acylase PvdQ